MTDQTPPTEPTGAEPLDGSVEPNALGASASVLAGSKRADRRARKSKEGSGFHLGPLRGAVLVLVGVVALAMIPAIGSAFAKTPKDRIGITYGGGPIEGSHYQEVIQPGSGLFFKGFFDPLYLYPSDQQAYIVSATKGEGSSDAPDTIVAPTKDRVQVAYQLAVYFKLNTDELRSFHEEFGLRYAAYTTAGWNEMIEATFRQQIENALQEETRRYTVAEIYGDAELLLRIQDSVQATLNERLQLAMGKRYFCSPTFEPGGPCEDPTLVIKTVTIPEAVATSFEQVRISSIDILTKENEVEQRKVEAEGIEALNEAFGDNGDVYALLKAIESGSVNFWVLPSDSGVALNTPDSATGDGAPTPTPAPGN